MLQNTRSNNTVPKSYKTSDRSVALQIVCMDLCYEFFYILALYKKNITCYLLNYYYEEVAFS